MHAHADIPIALIAPLTGHYAVFGDQLCHGAEQAVSDINAAGGVLGQKLAIKKYDDGCDPKEAVNAANKIAGDGLRLAVGHFCSGAGVAAMPVYMEEKILMVSPSVGHPKFTEDSDTYIARIALRINVQGDRIAAYLLKHFKDKRIAILNDKSAYGALLSSVVQKDLNAAGAKEILYDSYTAGEKDYTALATRLKDMKADIVMIGGYHSEIGLLAAQMRAQGNQAKIIGGTSLMTRELLSIAGKAAEGILLVFGPDMRKKKSAADVIAKLRKGGFEPEGYTLYSYAAVQVMAEAIKQTQSTDAKTVAMGLRKGTYHTIIDDFTFDATGDIKYPKMAVYHWHNGQYEVVEE